eukprot:CAMPEP_0194213888 /NCGR_PEP_ID=MMETSP0156-20130528/14771_1 /TAXON_ID=33649 /ORGANISM="Thalassionema nitzschioides, Strain L26-B" /LENGTH=365 /DNA_ID=CAMNT_0038942023 /DNA_START=197 /DNA_END=1294 /DNA_ORIENTATION=+
MTDGFVSPTRRHSIRPISMVPVVTDGEDSSITTKSFDWSFLDRVYLITCPNADPDQKRFEKAKQVLEEANLWDMVQVRSFDTDDEDRIRGCYSSHISVLKDAMKEIEASSSTKNIFMDLLKNVIPSSSPKLNYNILVLEDNIALTGNLDAIGLQEVRSYMDSEASWDVMHLSYIPYVPSLVVSSTTRDRIVQLQTGIGSALGTTAYIINEKAIHALLRQDQEQSYYAAIPDVMAELFPDTRYAAFPTPFLRAPKTKSLVNPQLDDLREILFQPAVTSAVQNVLTKTGISTNQLLPITIISLLSISTMAGKTSFDALSSLFFTGSYNGPILLSIMSLLVTLGSLGIIIQGIMLAPQHPQTAEENKS